MWGDTRELESPAPGFWEEEFPMCSWEEGRSWPGSVVGAAWQAEGGASGEGSVAGWLAEMLCMGLC